MTGKKNAFFSFFYRMREGQRNLMQADQEKMAAEIEKRERRDSAAAAAALAAVHADKVNRSRSRSRSGGDSPILNLTKLSGEANNRSGEQRQSSSLRLGSSGTRGPGSESPLSDGRNDDIGVTEDEDLDDDDSQPRHKKHKTDDKVNNNKEAPTSTPSSLASTLSLPGFPPGLAAGLAAAAGGADGSSPQQQGLGSIYGLIGNIQALLKMAVENAKQEERTLLTSSKMESPEVEELKKNTQVYLRRFKKEKRYRRRLQEQLEQETKRRVQMEEALRVTSAETLKRITESFKELEDKQKQQQQESADDETEDKRSDDVGADADDDDDDDSTKKSQTNDDIADDDNSDIDDSKVENNAFNAAQFAMKPNNNRSESASPPSLPKAGAGAGKLSFTTP